MNFKRIIRWLILLAILRSERGQPFSAPKIGSLKRLAAYNFVKRERLRAISIINLAKRRRKRRHHVRPILQDRSLYGAWFSLIPVMREFDQEEYFNFMRMTPDCFDWLLEKVSPIISKHSNRGSISAGERLAVTLRYLASGDSMASLKYLFRISHQGISNIILETTAAIWYVLKDEVFEPLSEDLWRKKASEFESMWQFPMCVGAVDGKHCIVQKFPMRGSELYNYKLAHSIVLLAVSDAKYKFIVVDVGARGRESDGGVFDRSEFGNLFNNHGLQLPPPAYNDVLKKYLPYVFVGDDAFGLHTHMMKPFDKTLKEEEVIFNYRLSRARRVVENAFGILSARFRILRRSILGSETLAQNIVLACTALHNLHLIREDSIPPRQRVYLPPGYADVYRSNGKLKKGRWRDEVKSKERSVFRRLATQESSSVISDSAHEVRENLLEYFVASPLPWQYNVLPDV